MNLYRVPFDVGDGRHPGECVVMADSNVSAVEQVNAYLKSLRGAEIQEGNFRILAPIATVNAVVGYLWTSGDEYEQLELSDEPIYNL